MAYENLPRLPDPTTNPPGPGFVSISMTNNISGMVHQLNNGASISVRNDGSFWEFSIQYPEMTPEEISYIAPFLEKCVGGFENFYLQNPLLVNPKTGAWNITTNTKIALGEISILPNSKNMAIVIPAWDTRGGNLSPGDAIKFTNSNKIYKVSSITVTANVATIYLSCPIVEPSKIPTCGLEPNGILFRVRGVEGQNLRLDFTTKGLYSAFSITLRENIL